MHPLSAEAFRPVLAAEQSIQASLSLHRADGQGSISWKML